jgi:hypothetical protein
MARLDGTPRRRILIGQGILVASTNQKQYSCIKALKDKIIHVYRCRNYKRISRFVQHSNTQDNGRNKNVKEK